MTIPFTVTPQTPKPEVGTPQTLNERLAHDAGMAADGSILPSKHGIIVGIGCPQSKASAVEFVATLTPGPYRLVCDDHAIIVACLFLKRHADLSILEESGPFSFQVDPECLIGEADTYDQLVALVSKMRDLCRDVLILQEYGGLQPKAAERWRHDDAISAVHIAMLDSLALARSIALGIDEDHSARHLIEAALVRYEQHLIMTDIGAQAVAVYLGDLGGAR